MGLLLYNFKFRYFLAGCYQKRNKIRKIRVGSEEVDQFLRTMPELVCVDCMHRLYNESERLQEVMRDLKVRVTNEQLSWFAPGSKQAVCSGTATRAAQQHELPLTTNAEYKRALDDYNRANQRYLYAQRLTKKERDQGLVCSLCGGTRIR